MLKLDNLIIRVTTYGIPLVFIASQLLKEFPTWIAVPIAYIAIVPFGMYVCLYSVQHRMNEASLKSLGLVHEIIQQVYNPWVTFANSLCLWHMGHEALAAQTAFLTKVVYTASVEDIEPAT